MFCGFRLWIVAGACAVLLGCATSGAGTSQLILSDDGLTEISAPPAWQTRPNLGRNADLRLADAMHDHYLLVTSYLPGDVKEMSLEQFAERLSGALLESLDGGKMSAPRPLAIGGWPAIEYELRATLGATPLVYFSTIVDGVQARYHLLGWAPADSDTAALRRVMADLRESGAPRKARERLNLSFKWPANLDVRASFLHKSSKRHGALELQGESVMSVKPAGKGELLISTRVTQQKMNSDSQRAGKDAGRDAYLQEVLKAALSDMPDFVVNNDGEFVRVENLAAYHKRVLDSMMKALPKGEAQAQAKAKQLLASMLTEEALSVSMQDEWNNLAESWAGGSYALGQSYEFTMPYQAPALQRQSFPMATTQQLAGHVPCTPNAAPKSCVRLLQNARVSGPDYTRAMNDYVRKTAGDQVSVTQMEVFTTLELITDPNTMLPYFTHKKQTKRVTVSAEGKTSTSDDVEESSVTYHY
jgi:hypothetical protein